MRLNPRHPRSALAVSLLATISLVAAACGGDDDDSADTDSTEGTAAADTASGATGSAGTAAAGGDADAAYAELIAAAEEEGSVTVYSGGDLDGLNATAAAFEEKYPGIEVEAVRSVDADTIARVETELATNTAGADLAILSAQDWVQQNADAGNFVDASASPQIAGLGDYDAEQYVHDGNFFEVGAAVLTFAWNTDEVPDGLTDYPDLLDESLAGGKIAVIDPAISASLVDFYLWLEESFGEDYVEQLAAQEPRIYPSALPIGEALASGEVFASAYAAPIQLVPSQESGAPVDFGISDSGAWGARFYGVIPKSTDSPNAAALLADFMVTAEGQELMQSNAGTVLPVEGSLITNDQVRVQDLEAIAPEPAAAYVEEWNALFR